jgi:predicted MPP superfamily phosphohydrolase
MLFEHYATTGADLVVSGHLHGGLFRLPFLGGIIAPGPYLFPHYAKGVFQKNGCTMVVSGGAGDHFPMFRINNRPELVKIGIRI